MTPELESLRAQLNHALDAHLPHTSTIAQAITDAMRHSVLGGGKRIRPMLACATSAAFEAEIERALPVACAVEFIHAYSLIHDDLPAMDDDDMRHGLPSAHIAFGEANAILAGDSLHSLAFQTIAETDHHSTEMRLRMIRLLAHAAGWDGMAGGQCLDIEAEGKDLNLDELKALHRAKTGALIKVSVQLGALCAGALPARDERFDVLSRYGDHIGLAFQVMDDVLDVTQSSERLGKPAGSDEALDKNTFPKLIGIDKATSLAKSLVDESLELLAGTGLRIGPLQDLARLVVDRDH